MQFGKILYKDYGRRKTDQVTVFFVYFIPELSYICCFSLKVVGQKFTRPKILALDSFFSKWLVVSVYQRANDGDQGGKAVSRFLCGSQHCFAKYHLRL